ncbi:N-myc-interactor [Neolamprologus brichardi]|uniref:N-myc-interactor n=1 Tax=Neolamprologus brichardi TaxID=32507 RepID=UPI001643E252|nr:N-myc-interactor [Neolamprologus brichardi]
MFLISGHKRLTTAIYAQIPDTEVKFISQNKETREEGDEDSQPIRGVFTISQRAAVLLQGGQALITFEEEKVARQILKIAKCSVSCENSSLDVKPRRITMDPAVKFEVDAATVSSVKYDKNTGTWCVTFLQPGVTESLVLRGRYDVELDTEVKVQVGPIYEYQLRRFQTFCGCPKRTILLDDIQDMVDEEDLQDHLEIHFQKPSNSGGEIESIKYIAKPKVLQAFLCESTEEKDDSL